MIHREMCKRLNFCQDDKRYMDKLESVPENKTHKIFRDFKMKTDHPLTAIWPDLVVINNKKQKYQHYCSAYQS